MAPGAVRQEPRQGRDQLGWLEQVVLGSTDNGSTWQPASGRGPLLEETFLAKYAKSWVHSGYVPELFHLIKSETWCTF